MRGAPMTVRLLACLLVAALVAAGCGDEETRTDTGGGDALTVYSSFPLSAGDQRGEAAALVEGIELALAERGGEAGGFRVEHRSLDNSSAEEGGLTPELEAANARTAAQDETAVAYIGGISFAAAAISIPILNEAGIVQVSPGTGYSGLTRRTAVSQPGEPEKYYPTGERNFARIVPLDVYHAAALAGVMEDAGCASAFLAAEEEVASRALAHALRDDLRRRGVAIAGEEAFDGAQVGDVAAAAAEARPGCVALVTRAPAAAVAAYEALGEALPRARLFGAEGACRPALTPPPAHLEESLLRRITCTAWVRERRSYPDADVELEDPVALYGYEAMRLVLDAIERGGGDRDAVRRALLSTGERKGPFGEYRLDGRGDATLDTFAVYRVRGGRLRQTRLVQPPG